MKKIIVSAAVLFAVSAQGADDVLAVFLKSAGFFDSVTVSSTNLTLKLLPDWRLWVTENKKGLHPRETSRFPERGATISLIPDVETRLSDGYHV